MMGVSPNCAMILTGGFELLLWAGAALVWLAASHSRVAGPCRLAVVLLLTTQLCASARGVGEGWAVADWVWLLQTTSYFAFLYLLYHMVALLEACRR